MSSEEPNQVANQPVPTSQPATQEQRQDQSDPTPDSPQALAGLVDAMDSVDTNSPNADQNATSISDNNGSRIELNEDPAEVKDYQK